MHHLFPCKSNVNSSRGNILIDIIDEETDVWYRDDYSQETMGFETLGYEYAEKLNGQEPLFEPREIHKGDAAIGYVLCSSIYNENADLNFWNAH